MTVTRAMKQARLTAATIAAVLVLTYGANAKPALRALYFNLREASPHLQVVGALTLTAWLATNPNFLGDTQLFTITRVAAQINMILLILDVMDESPGQRNV